MNDTLAAATWCSTTVFNILSTLSCASPVLTASNAFRYNTSYARSHTPNHTLNTLTYILNTVGYTPNTFSIIWHAQHSADLVLCFTNAVRYHTSHTNTSTHRISTYSQHCRMYHQHGCSDIFTAICSQYCLHCLVSGSTISWRSSHTKQDQLAIWPTYTIMTIRQSDKLLLTCRSIVLSYFTKLYLFKTKLSETANVSIQLRLSHYISLIIWSTCEKWSHTPKYSNKHVMTAWSELFKNIHTKDNEFYSDCIFSISTNRGFSEIVLDLTQKLQLTRCIQYLILMQMTCYDA